MARQEFGSLTKILALNRAGNRCECAGCPTCPPWGCSKAEALEFDHIVANNDNGLGNIRVLCKACHQTKTSWVASLLGGKQTSEATAYGNALHEMFKSPYESYAREFQPSQPPDWLPKIAVPHVPLAPMAVATQDLYNVLLRALEPKPIDWLAQLGFPSKPYNS